MPEDDAEYCDDSLDQSNGDAEEVEDCDAGDSDVCGDVLRLSGGSGGLRRDEGKWGGVEKNRVGTSRRGLACYGRARVVFWQGAYYFRRFAGGP